MDGFASNVVGHPGATMLACNQLVVATVTGAIEYGSPS